MDSIANPRYLFDSQIGKHTVTTFIKFLYSRFSVRRHQNLSRTHIICQCDVHAQISFDFCIPELVYLCLDSLESLGTRIFTIVVLTVVFDDGNCAVMLYERSSTKLPASFGFVDLKRSQAILGHSYIKAHIC